MTAATHDRWFPRLARAMSNAVEFRIGLRTGETLIVDATTALAGDVVRPAGRPRRRIVRHHRGTAGPAGDAARNPAAAQLAAAVDRVDLSAGSAAAARGTPSAPEIRAVDRGVQPPADAAERDDACAHDRSAASPMTFVRSRPACGYVSRNSRRGRTAARGRRHRRHDPPARRCAAVEPRRAGQLCRRWWILRRLCAPRPTTAAPRAAASNCRG